MFANAALATVPHHAARLHARPASGIDPEPPGRTGQAGSDSAAPAVRRVTEARAAARSALGRPAPDPALPAAATALVDPARPADPAARLRARLAYAAAGPAGDGAPSAVLSVLA